MEVVYLRRLVGQCNELAQASDLDARPDLVEQRQPRLQHVYVDLDTTQAPTLAQAFARLPLAAATQTNLVAAFPRLQQRLDRDAAQKLGRDAETINAGIPADAIQKLEKQFKLTEGALMAALTPKLSVQEALRTTPQLVLLSDPGGGKSTLTQRLAGVLAGAILPHRDADEERWLSETVNCFGRWLLPVRIELSRWAHRLTPASRGVASDLVDACGHAFAQVATLEATAVQNHLLNRLTATPTTLLLLLDGLDEVSDEAQRLQMLRAVADFRRTYGDVPIIITCRVRPYRQWTQRAGQKKEQWPLQNWPTFELAPLSQSAITAFVERWHAELAWAGRLSQGAADQAQQRLLAALANPNRRDLREMAGTPLLLTMMVRINQRRPLPDSRAELYDEYVDELLWEWERRKLDERGETSLETLLAEAHVPRDLLEEALAHLAWTIHGATTDGDTVEIPGHRLEAALRDLYPDDDVGKQAAWAARTLQLIYDRTGLIYATDRHTYRFRHRTFQEYLAARHLLAGDALENLTAVLDQEPWREAIFLAFGHLISVVKQADHAMRLLAELLPTEPATPAEWQRVLLLGAVYARLLGEQRVRQSKWRKTAAPLSQTMPRLLTAAMQNPALPARSRLEAGLLLTRGVTDPPGLGLDEDPPGLDDFVGAPDWPFKIGRYPVTNKQYARFVAAGGYDDAQWWSEKGWTHRQEREWKQPRYWHDPTWNRHSQPVVGVSWYEAEAYCAWLTAELRQQGEIGENQQVRLPTEAEWQIAAHTADHAYPWSDSFDPTKANTRESSLNQTAPVHMYPHGATAEGIYDLSGNAWEWIADWNEEKYPCFKGGSYHLNKDYAKFTSRRYVPYLGNYDFGFRCVVAPLPCG